MISDLPIACLSAIIKTMSNIIDKPWGKEIILTESNLPFTAKILEIYAGSKLSLQYHDQKIETLTLFQGSANITLGNSMENLITKPMEKKIGYTFTPKTIHRIEAITDCTVFEASTPETGTTYRLQDDYQRQNETQTVRDLPNRGWKNEK